MHAHQTRRKNRRDPKLPIARHLQPPNTNDGQHEDGKVRHDVERGRNDIDRIEVNAVSRERRGPVFADGVAAR